MISKLYDESSPRRLAHFVGGKSFAGDGQRWGDIYNPATGEVVTQVPLGGAGDVDAALAAATAALSGWADTTPLRRARILFKFKELLERNADEIAALITHEHGKVLSDAKGEVTRGLEVVEFACGIPHLLKG
ncbi:MAG: aldehyde dehydrogenase family protein, partial [Actinomycetota bacterium]|nr:aldehyde dehydrogenase family protein [Actinomycetota bacterium]